jgi:hypothetical protein
MGNLLSLVRNPLKVFNITNNRNYFQHEKMKKVRKKQTDKYSKENIKNNRDGQ